MRRGPTCRSDSSSRRRPAFLAVSIRRRGPGQRQQRRQGGLLRLEGALGRLPEGAGGEPRADRRRQARPRGRRPRSLRSLSPSPPVPPRNKAPPLAGLATRAISRPFPGVQPLDLPLVRRLRVPTDARVEGARRLILKLLLPGVNLSSDRPRSAARSLQPWPAPAAPPARSSPSTPRQSALSSSSSSFAPSIKRSSRPPT